MKNKFFKIYVLCLITLIAGSSLGAPKKDPTKSPPSSQESAKKKGAKKLKRLQLPAIGLSRPNHKIDLEVLGKNKQKFRLLSPVKTNIASLVTFMNWYQQSFIPIYMDPATSLLFLPMFTQFLATIQESYHAVKRSISEAALSIQADTFAMEAAHLLVTTMNGDCLFHSVLLLLQDLGGQHFESPQELRREFVRRLIEQVKSKMIDLRELGPKIRRMLQDMIDQMLQNKNLPASLVGIDLNVEEHLIHALEIWGTWFLTPTSPEGTPPAAQTFQWAPESLVTIFAAVFGVNIQLYEFNLQENNFIPMELSESVPGAVILNIAHTEAGKPYNPGFDESGLAPIANHFQPFFPEGVPPAP